MNGEIPATKLIALQKVLQSDFMNAVREVYEHVYETVDIQGSQDVRASATAKATVAAFAASEGHAHPRVVELPKTDEGERVRQEHRPSKLFMCNIVEWVSGLWSNFRCVRFVCK